MNNVIGKTRASVKGAMREAREASLRLVKMLPLAKLAKTDGMRKILKLGWSDP
jgi:hypothetical protein